jgi:hypothetical protein
MYLNYDFGFRHFSIIIDNMDDAVKELESKGVVFHSKPIRFEMPKEI